MGNYLKKPPKPKNYAKVLVEAEYKVTPDGHNLFVHIVLRESIRNKIICNFALGREQIRTFEREMAEIEKQHGSKIVSAPKPQLIIARG